MEKASLLYRHVGPRARTIFFLQTKDVAKRSDQWRASFTRPADSLDCVEPTSIQGLGERAKSLRVAATSL